MLLWLLYYFVITLLSSIYLHQNCMVCYHVVLQCKTFLTHELDPTFFSLFVSVRVIWPASNSIITYLGFLFLFIFLFLLGFFLFSLDSYRDYKNSLGKPGPSFSLYSFFQINSLEKQGLVYFLPPTFHHSFISFFCFTFMHF